MHRLHAPAARAKLDGQPVEQRAMNRILALHAEIFGGLDDAGAEEVLPHAIDLHAGGQRVLGHDQPSGKPESIGRAALGQRRQERRAWQT